jgi:hypothetical protein
MHVGVKAYIEIKWPTTLFQFGGIRFLGETVYYTKSSTYTELEPVYVCVRC